VLESSARVPGPQATLDVNALALGTYVVEIIGADRRATAKWTKVE
jgi:hypothetical protein